MDQLDLLKKDWKKQEESFPKLSYQELSKLIHKKSSSIVKWIFIISILEFFIPHLIMLAPGYDSAMKNYEEIGLGKFLTVFYSVYYVVIIGFIILFYKNYRSINTNSNPKTLMHNIIKTRRIVKYYIWFNLALIPFVTGVIFNRMMHSQAYLDLIPEGTNTSMVWFLLILIIVVFVALAWLFYQLIYGILLNKLKKNYDELVSNGVEGL